MIKEPKVPISLRVHPDLKLEIENEAIAANLTTSKYLEKIIHKRHQESDELDYDVNAEWEKKYNELNDEYRELQTENEEFEESFLELLRENRQLKKDLEEQSAQLDSLQFDYQQMQEQEVHRIDISFDAEEEVTFNDLFERLRNVYPDVNTPQLLLACLQATLKNEDSYLFIHTPKAYLEKLEAQKIGV